MSSDVILKSLLQLCADVQDGLWEAAAHSRRTDLAALFERAAMAWNAFADRLFPILLATDHTSPHAKWISDPNRSWMNLNSDLDRLDDLAICEECMQGLLAAKAALEQANVINIPQVRELLKSQVRTIEEQRSEIVRAVADPDRRAV